MTKNRGAIYSNNAIFVEDFDRSQKLEFNFEILKIIFRKNNFTIIQANITWNNQRVLFNQNKSTVLGNFYDPKVGDILSGTGTVEHSQKHGYSIRLQGAPETYIPRTQKEIVRFLTSQIDGIGKIKANKIFDYFGEDTIKILSETPEAVKDVDTVITEKTLNSIKQKLVHGTILNKVFSVLNVLNVRESLALELYEKYGGNTYNELLSNPYIIAEINPLYWRTADSFYFKQVNNNSDYPNLTVAANNNSRYRTAIKYFLKLKLELSGSLALPYKKIVEVFGTGEFLCHLSLFGTLSSEIDEAKVKTLLDELETEQEIYYNSSSSGEKYVYLQQSFLAETNIVQSIRHFNRNSFKKANEDDVDSFIELYEEHNKFTLAENQKQAVDLLANNKISILTGGPGSGKTTTVKAIKEFVDYLGQIGKIPEPKICLLAPTGKAAKRLSEVLQVPASTIHRKLKLKGFGKDEVITKIEDDFVIVDESSMIDIYLFSHLLQSLGPNTNLLLVGDENQLPSVGAGLVLRDLIESKKVNTITLNKVFRQSGDSQIITNANLMKHGVGIESTGQSLIFNKTQDSYFVETQNSQDSLKKTIQSYKRMLQKGYSPEDILILVAQNKGDLGTLNLNREIQKMQKHSLTEQVLIRKQDNTAFYIGDPVIQLVNDYENNVFNGETGTVTDILVSDSGQKILEVTYEGDTVDENRVVEYKGYSIYDINLAYVITVFKSQGSEAKCVIQVVDGIQKRMLNRSLVYTGYTRTKEVNIIIGQKETLNQSLKDTSNLERTSLIKEKL